MNPEKTSHTSPLWVIYGMFDLEKRYSHILRVPCIVYIHVHVYQELLLYRTINVPVNPCQVVQLSQNYQLIGRQQQNVRMSHEIPGNINWPNIAMSQMLQKNNSTQWGVTLIAKTGTTKFVPYHPVKSLQFIWRLVACKFHWQEPNLQKSYSNLTIWYGTNVKVLIMATREICHMTLFDITEGNIALYWDSGFADTCIVHHLLSMIFSTFSATFLPLEISE